MPYIQKEDIQKVKEIDLLTYLENTQPDMLVKISNNVYCTKEHDSLRISNGMWNWFSRGIGGRSALDYLIKVEGYSFLDAVEMIGGKSLLTTPIRPSKVESKEKTLLLPNKSDTNDKVIDYLNSRGIDKDVVEYCIDKGYIFESLPYHNAVFVGYDETNKPKFASFRACTEKRIMGDCRGSDKHYSFNLLTDFSKTIHLFECPIDLLSYATLLKLNGKDFTKFNLISLAGVYKPRDKIEESKVPAALQNYLDKHSVDSIYIHFDNDEVGRMATLALQSILPKNIEVIDYPVSKGKDVNDFLLYKIKMIKNERSSNYER